MMSASALRTSKTSDVISNAARQKTVAFQAAEAALHICESNINEYLAAYARAVADQTPLPTPTFPIHSAPAGPDESFRWTRLDETWDSANASVYAIPIATINQTLRNHMEFKRSPECSAQYLNINDMSQYVLTVRGFGPEVAEYETGSRKPAGTETWLQSIVQLAPIAPVTP